MFRSCLCHREQVHFKYNVTYFFLFNKSRGLGEHRVGRGLEGSGYYIKFNSFVLRGFKLKPIKNWPRLPFPRVRDKVKHLCPSVGAQK